MQRNQHAGADASHSDHTPQAEQEKDLPPGLVAGARTAVGEGIDDATEQQGTDEGCGGERDVRHDQRGRKSAFGREQARVEPLEPQEAHFDDGNPTRRGIVVARAKVVFLKIR
jgi:hypothetical protein